MVLLNTSTSNRKRLSSDYSINQSNGELLVKRPKIQSTLDSFLGMIKGRNHLSSPNSYTHTTTTTTSTRITSITSLATSSTIPRSISHPDRLMNINHQSTSSQNKNGLDIRSNNDGNSTDEEESESNSNQIRIESTSPISSNTSKSNKINKNLDASNSKKRSSRRRRTSRPVHCITKTSETMEVRKVSLRASSLPTNLHAFPYHYTQHTHHQQQQLDKHIVTSSYVLHIAKSSEQLPKRIYDRPGVMSIDNEESSKIMEDVITPQFETLNEEEIKMTSFVGRGRRKLETMENLSDDIFFQRHRKQVLREKRTKARDIEWIRHQRYRYQLQKEQELHRAINDLDHHGFKTKKSNHLQNDQQQDEQVNRRPSFVLACKTGPIGILFQEEKSKLGFVEEREEALRKIKNTKLWDIPKSKGKLNVKTDMKEVASSSTAVIPSSQSVSQKPVDNQVIANSLNEQKFIIKLTPQHATRIPNSDDNHFVSKTRDSSSPSYFSSIWTLDVQTKVGNPKSSSQTQKIESSKMSLLKQQEKLIVASSSSYKPTATRISAWLSNKEQESQPLQKTDIKKQQQQQIPKAEQKPQTKSKLTPKSSPDEEDPKSNTKRKDYTEKQIDHCQSQEKSSSPRRSQRSRQVPEKLVYERNRLKKSYLIKGYSSLPSMTKLDLDHCSRYINFIQNS